jgi:GTP cyclohydrolase I
MGFNEDTVRTLLEGIGEDPDREGLRETPARVVAAWSDWTSGYDRDPKSILKVFKDAQYNELVFQADIPVWSMCEHHVEAISSRRNLRAPAPGTRAADTTDRKGA